MGQGQARNVGVRWRYACAPALAVLALAGACALVGAGPVRGEQGPRLHVELNRAEQVDDACRLSFLMKNAMGVALSQMSLQIVIFGADEQIRQVVTLSAGAMQKDKQRVRQFDLPQTACGDIARILLNEVSACAGASEGAEVTPEACLAATHVSSRADIELVL